MPFLRNLRFRAEYALIRSGAALLRRLPLDAAGAVTGALVAAIAPATSLHRRAMANLGVAFPEATVAERRRIAAEMWRNTGRMIAETIQLDRILSDPTLMEIRDLEAWTRSLAIPGPKVAVTLHLGNWELIAVAAGRLGLEFAGVYRRQRNPYFDRYLRKTRSPLFRSGMYVKSPRRSPSSLEGKPISLHRLLKEGGHLGLVCDQIDAGAPFRVPFFGHEATFTPAPAILARQIGARIFITRCVRRGLGSRFVVDVNEMKLETTTDRNADLRRTTARIANQFETWIREDPAQWMWWQRRSIVG
jgi:KDO2-lipid IV(A) lauroyltransferase